MAVGDQSWYNQMASLLSQVQMATMDLLTRVESEMGMGKREQGQILKELNLNLKLQWEPMHILDTITSLSLKNAKSKFNKTIATIMPDARTKASLTWEGSLVSHRLTRIPQHAEESKETSSKSLQRSKSRWLLFPSVGQIQMEGTFTRRGKLTLQTRTCWVITSSYLKSVNLRLHLTSIEDHLKMNLQQLVRTEQHLKEEELLSTIKGRQGNRCWAHSRIQQQGWLLRLQTFQVLDSLKQDPHEKCQDTISASL